MSDKVKLVIMIGNDFKYTRECAESQILVIAKAFQEVVSAPICVIAQPNNRDNTNNEDFEKVGNALAFNSGNELLFFNSHQVILFHFTVINGTEPDDSKKIFSTIIFNESKRTINNDSITYVTTPSKFEFLTRSEGSLHSRAKKRVTKTFPDIPLCTLRLFNESSMTVVDYQVETEFRFHAGHVYAIVGVRKFGGENPVMGNLSEESD
uniref:tRNA pseudouridine synthase n=2 Tax=Loa loa TaxID=7209 RepID=A0A1I7VB23_LOALO